MDVREKLVEMLENHCSVIGEDNCKASQNEKCTPRDCAICLASNLIANGVTVQEHCHKAESEISKTGLMCTACHSDIDRDAVFCKYCGAKVMPKPPKER